jgi:hypothetical protein
VSGTLVRERSRQIDPSGPRSPVTGAATLLNKLCWSAVLWLALLFIYLWEPMPAAIAIASVGATGLFGALCLDQRARRVGQRQALLPESVGQSLEDRRAA